MATRMITHVEVFTHECASGEAYQHDLPDSTDPVLITQAVYTLYGAEGVTAMSMEAMEVEDTEE